MTRIEFWHMLCSSSFVIGEINAHVNRDRHENEAQKQHGRPLGRGPALCCFSNAHTPAAWVGVLGWLRPMVEQSQPAKSTSSASDLLIKA